MLRRKPSTEKQQKTETERMKVEISAGGIVFKRTPKGVRVAFIMDPYSKWAFAKGHVEKGETVEHAAPGRPTHWLEDRHRRPKPGRRKTRKERKDTKNYLGERSKSENLFKL